MPVIQRKTFDPKIQNTNQQAYPAKREKPPESVAMSIHAINNNPEETMKISRLRKTCSVTVCSTNARKKPPSAPSSCPRRGRIDSAVKIVSKAKKKRKKRRQDNLFISFCRLDTGNWRRERKKKKKKCLKRHSENKHNVSG
jgi:hypothetical protein